MLTLYGVARSRASRVIWLCHEIGLPFRHVPVIQAYRLPFPEAPDAPFNTRSPEFLALSPQGAIPVIEDEGLVLAESMACTLHLARVHGGDLGGRDAQEAALILQWSLYAATSIESDALTIQMLHRPQADAGDRALVEDAGARLGRPLTLLDRHLARNGHLVGNRFTVADLNMAEVLRYAQARPGVIEDHPALRGWLAACQARPAFRAMWQAREAEPA